MDEKLAQVLHKVELLCEQNPEFADALKEKLGIKPTVVTSQVSAVAPDERVDRIEHYLGLDYSLDVILPSRTKYRNVDYSFVTDLSLREQLESDFREMMRFRYGCRSHKEDFIEFCKYAHFQLEALVNDYIEMWSLNYNGEVDINKIKNNISENWPPSLDKPKFRDKAVSVNDIDYFQKKTAILHSLGMSNNVISRVSLNSIFFPGQTIYLVNYLSDTIDFIRRARNDYSHRGINIGKSMEETIEEYEKRKHVTSHPTYGLQYEFSKFEKDAHYYMWRKRAAWEDVVNTILCMIEADKKMYDKTAK